MPSAEQLRAARDLLRRAGIDIAHYAPGRVRLRVARVKTDAAFAARLERGLVAVPGVRSVRLRPLTGSVLIEFTPGVLGAAPTRAALLDSLAALFPQLDGQRLGRLLAAV